MGQELDSSGVLEVGNRPIKPRNHPQPSKNVGEERKKFDAQLREYKSIEMQRIEYMSIGRDILKELNFVGEPLEIGPVLDTQSTWSIGNSVATIHITIIQNENGKEELERSDSLKKDKLYFHSNLIGTLIFPNGAKHSVVDGDSLEGVLRSGIMLLKYIERLQYPERFGYKSVYFEKDQSGKIRQIGESVSGKKFTIPFFGHIDFKKDGFTFGENLNDDVYKILLHYLRIPEGEHI